MKAWVKEFLIERHDKLIKKIQESESSSIEWIKEDRYFYSQSLDDEEYCFAELLDCLNCHFGIHSDTFEHIFRRHFVSVVAELPQKVLEHLCSMKNLFFTFESNPAPEIKFLYAKQDIKAGDRLYIVNFPFTTITMNDLALRGTIAHEIAHLYKHLDIPSPDDSVEDEADEISRKWGFDAEITAMKKYLRDMGDEGQKV